ncbi:hypothetical protein GJ699_01950 [Duganella sp. FT80W]|uniref:Uncharacterized protein n=1 Tax=Duganella guangzhouensis TaxID=2666084 RepID=A0A6I2KWF9_9BURK|nr:hypothetical protein [Duganella guangzhouensis]MRW88744.1 hypothetical protein [Duganella guangzhouensis]
MASDFYKYFKENMDSLGLDCPETLFATKGAAIQTATTLLSAIQQHGSKVTVSELIGAGTGLEKLIYLGALRASFYAGAVVGSIAVATGRTLAGGTSLSDVLISARSNNLHRPWLAGVLMRWPGIYNSQVTSRQHYRQSWSRP